MRCMKAAKHQKALASSLMMYKIGAARSDMPCNMQQGLCLCKISDKIIGAAQIRHALQHAAKVVPCRTSDKVVSARQGIRPQHDSCSLQSRP